MYKITRLYTNGVLKRQEPVLAKAVKFGRLTTGPVKAVAWLNDEKTLPPLDRSVVCHIDTFCRFMSIGGLEEVQTGDSVTNVWQIWEVEEVVDSTKA